MVRAALKYSEQVHVLTFQPHPASILSPGRAPVRLMDYEDQKRVLLQVGAAQVEAIRFSQEFSQLSGEDFFKNEILSRSPEAVVVGEDFRFGRRRECGVIELANFCKNAHIQFEACPAVLEGDRPVSSTWIREALLQGQFSVAKILLGRPYEFSGQVVQGKMLGRTIGFPTANLSLASEREGRLPLPSGVYAGYFLFDKDSRPHEMVMNLGFAPTVHEDKQLKVEVHALNLHQDFYGQKLRVQPLSYLRAEQKFSGLEALKAQIQKDVLTAKDFFSKELEPKA